MQVCRNLLHMRAAVDHVLMLSYHGHVCVSVCACVCVLCAAHTGDRATKELFTLSLSLVDLLSQLLANATTFTAPANTTLVTPSSTTLELSMKGPVGPQGHLAGMDWSQAGLGRLLALAVLHPVALGAPRAKEGLQRTMQSKVRSKTRTLCTLWH